MKKNVKTLAGKWALVTGASSGIGADIARNLAAAGCHLVLTARRQERLDALQEQLQQDHGVQVETISNDLSIPSGPQELFDAVESLNIPVALLVNNAGIGLNGRFSELDLQAQMGLIQLNVASLTELTHRFLTPMLARNEGWILNVASLYAFNLGPGYAVYAATKHYVLNLTESLNCELQGTGVQVTALCPGPTRTEFFDVSGQQSSAMLDKVLMDSDQVAKEGIAALLAGKPFVVAGSLNRLMASSVKFFPKSIQAMLTKQFAR